MSDYWDCYNEVQYSESDSARFYDPTMDYHEGYVDSERKEEYSDISLQSYFESNREEDPSMEVEEVFYRDSLSVSDTADSESDEPPAPKAPPKAPPRVRHSGASKLPRVTCEEASSSSEEDTPPPKANSPRAHAPTPKPRKVNKAAAPMPAPETGKTADHSQNLSEHMRRLDGSINISDYCTENCTDGGSGLCLVSPEFSFRVLRTSFFLRVAHGGKIRIRPGLSKYACELTLDPNTVHIDLSLSEGNRKATSVREQQPYPDHPERFDVWLQVLCRESLSGRCYWEAEYSGRGAAIAVTYKGISRKGGGDDCRFGYNEKSWRIYCTNNTYSVWHNKKITDIPSPRSSTNRIGVYLDWPAGILSFYIISSDSHTLTHVHTFHTTFTEPLYGGFWVGFDSSVWVSQIE
ncbi:hypothetical protein P4O66_021209 [Electrophorus voltai]|uniref:B30.2/SPRY domain-containing protein n=1 Tax=Electrophorus voltai TaxID=2609070 RepID=A0AAD8ZPN7_9TELE|nr:hypothetical protein P4O66_021209 [Electrophorus voltai]